jgi:hypothetical protein
MLARCGKEMCRLALEAEDERVRSVCTGMVLERAWGKPREYDPNAEGANRKSTFDPSLYTLEELETLQAAMLMMARRQGLMSEEEGEETMSQIHGTRPETGRRK